MRRLSAKHTLSVIIFFGIIFSFQTSKGIARTLQKDKDKIPTNAKYSFNIFFSVKQKKIHVKEKIIWRNKTNFSTDRLLFHLYANAYKSNKTIFAQAYKLDKEEQTSLNIKVFKIDNVPSSLEFITPDVPNPHDSTVAQAFLSQPLLPGDSVKIEFEYSLKIPKSVKRFGYAPHADFFFVSQWFPKLGVFENGQWNCHQYFPYLNFYSDFADYQFILNLPSNFKVAATGIQTKIEVKKERKIVEYSQKGVHDFAWVASKNSEDTIKIYRGKNGREIKVRLFLYETDTKYTERFFKAVFNSLRFFEEHIFPYPYEQITVVDVPRTSRSGGMEYPTLIAVSANLLSPLATHQPEKLLIHEFSHQFFYGILANNETEEAWLDEGFASYFADKITSEYYGNGKLSFRFLGEIPVYGINYYSFCDIPIIYSLGYYDKPEYSSALKRYYLEPALGTIADTSYLLPTRLAYVVNAYSKPEIMLTVLERMLGENKFFKLLRNYAKAFKFRHPKGKDFWEFFLKEEPSLNWFVQQIYYGTQTFDDRIRYLKQTGDNEYELFVERLRDGYFPHRIAVYTEKDTLYLNWHEKGRYKIFRFRSPHKVISADIDPKRINLFDLNFANNSYTIQSQPTGKYSLIMRWFFWLQNALMILGSAG